jgi:hypothetical protein
MDGLRLSLPGTISALTAGFTRLYWDLGRLEAIRAHRPAPMDNSNNDPFWSPPDRLPPVEDEVYVYDPCSYGMAIDSFGI